MYLRDKEETVYNQKQKKGCGKEGKFAAKRSGAEYLGILMGTMRRHQMFFMKTKDSISL